MTPTDRVIDRLAPPSVVFVALLVGWSVAAAKTPSILLPAPSAVLETVLADPMTFLRAGAVSAVTASAGLGLGVLLGLGFAFVAVGSEPGRAVVEPAVVGFRIAPLTAVAPLVLLWFGTGIAVRAVLVALMTTFPVTVASIDGLESTPRRYLDLLDSIGASKWETFWSVRVPAALPSVFAGVKLGAVLSVTGTVVAELLTLRGGLGAGVWEAGQFVRTAELFAYLLAVALFGVAFYAAVAAAERAAIRRWGIDD
jgi:ABC-type nitrate/sulfonate/bicarbonate transport system permease component